MGVEQAIPTERRQIKDRGLSEQAEKICLELIRSDIELAFACLRLARDASRRGITSDAMQLMENAILAYKVVTTQLGKLPAKFDDERRELQQSAQILLRAIVATARRFEIP